jgi:hypothetical protein
MENTLIYSASELEKFILSNDKDFNDYFLDKNQQLFEGLINTSFDSTTPEINLELLAWIYFKQKEKPLNLILFKQQLLQLGLKKIAEKQFNFRTGCVSIINFFLIPDNNDNQSLEILLKELFASKDFVALLSYNVDYQESDFTVSDGTTGILIFIFNCLEKNKTDLRILNSVIEIEQICLQAINSLLIHILPVSKKEQNLVFFPDYVSIVNRQTAYQIENTQAWSKGDLGKIYLLYKAGYYFGKQSWINIADNMGEYLCGLDHKLNSDYSISKGTAGGAVMFRKLFELTNKPIYQNHYNKYLNETLNHLNMTDSIIDNDLLNGKLGAYLVLKGNLKNDFGWTKILLL